MANRIEIHPGVFRHLDHYQAVYSGTPAAIVSAGLAKAQDVDAPGVRTINPDGSRAERGQNYGKSQAIGKKVIQVRNVRRSVTVQVRIWLSVEQRSAIESKRVRDAACWPFPIVIGRPPHGGMTGARLGGHPA